MIKLLWLMQIKMVYRYAWLKDLKDTKTDVQNTFNRIGNDSLKNDKNC